MSNQQNKETISDPMDELREQGRLWWGLFKDVLKHSTPISILVLAGSVFLSSPHSPLAQEQKPIPIEVTGEIGVDNAKASFMGFTVNQLR